MGSGSGTSSKSTQSTSTNTTTENTSNVTLGNIGLSSADALAIVNGAQQEVADIAGSALSAQSQSNSQAVLGIGQATNNLASAFTSFTSGDKYSGSVGTTNGLSSDELIIGLIAIGAIVIIGRIR